MTDSSFTVGKRPRTRWAVELEGAAVDPPFVALVIKNPSGETVSFFGESGQAYTLYRESAGVYYADLPLIVSGLWVRRWVAFDEQGDPLDAFEREFRVVTSKNIQPLPATP